MGQEDKKQHELRRTKQQWPNESFFSSVVYLYVRSFFPLLSDPTEQVSNPISIDISTWYTNALHTNTKIKLCVIHNPFCESWRKSAAHDPRAPGPACYKSALILDSRMTPIEAENTLDKNCRSVANTSPCPSNQISFLHQAVAQWPQRFLYVDWRQPVFPWLFSLACKTLLIFILI